MADYLLLPATFLLSFLATWLIVRLAKSQHWLDHPNSRSSHSQPTPTGGGVAFFSIFVIAILFDFLDMAAGFNHYLVLLLCSCIAVVGLADDILKLGIRVRIFTQLVVVAGALAMFGLPGLPFFSITVEPGWLGYLFFVWAFLWFINLFNFMDGIDGLAAMETVFMCLAFFLITDGDNNSDISSLLLVLAASVSGFLLLNLAPAKIFMGDIGSNFLGYIIGVAALVSTTTGISNIWVWCILAGIFIVDASYTLIVRMFSGETWYFAHRAHAYQLAATHLGSHGKVVIGVTFINCFWLLPLAWLSHANSGLGFVLVLLAWGPLLFLEWLICSGRLFRQTVH